MIGHYKKVEFVQTDVYFIEQENVIGKRGLIVSDIHFGISVDFTVSFPSIIKDLCQTISKNNIDVLYILGDIVEGGKPHSVENFLYFLEYLNKLEIPIYIIGGNHDRNVMKRCKKNNFHNVKIVTELLMALECPSCKDPNFKRIFLGHDLSNYPRLKNAQVLPWIRDVKTVYSSIIAPEDMLFTGHCHVSTLDTEFRVGTVGTFSVDYSGREGIIIECDENGLKYSFINKPAIVHNPV